jgi:hypothetical protein
MALQIREAYMDTTAGEVLSQTGWRGAAAPTREALLGQLQEAYGGNVQPLMLQTTKPEGQHLPYPARPIADRRETTVTDSGWIFTDEDAREGDPVREIWVEVREEPEAERDMEAG